MRITKAIVTVAALAIFSIINVDRALPQDDQEWEAMTLDEDLEQELKWLEAETYVITASKVMEEIEKASASISVINDRQIKQMGAKHLQDVINREIPSYSSVLFVAGIYRPHVRGHGSKVLNMINSHPIYDIVWRGLNQWGYDTLPMDNVKRIEIVRGPGSALYGSGAYDGVINVITKGADDIDGVELTARGGSWDTQQYNLLFGKTLKDLEVVLDFNYFKTHGHRALIEEEEQTLIEEEQTQSENAQAQYNQLSAFLLNSSPLSLAPGSMKGGDEKYDLALNLKFKGFTLDGRYVDRDWNAPYNFSSTWSTEKSALHVEDYYLNLNYETTIREGLDLFIKGYRQQLYYIHDFQYVPPSGDPEEVISPIWPEGVRNSEQHKEYHMGIEIQSTYRIHDFMTIVAGATYEKQEILSGKFWGNFLPADTPGVFIPSASSQSDLDIPPGELNYIAFFLEDIWDITRHIRLTTGLRYDEYSNYENDLFMESERFDFPGHFSPRAGLTWEYVEGYDLKLLYGHAFVVPYTLHALNPSGSPLDPQTVDTYEISLGAEFTSSMKGRLTLYQRDEENFIIAETDGPTNIGKLRSRGVEVEARYDFGRGTYLAGNYSYSSWPDDTTDYYAEGNIPEYMGKIMANIRLSRHFNLYADCQHFGGMSRESEGDLRGETKDYTIVNATLTARKFLKCCEELELRASVYNLFDENWLSNAEDIPHGWTEPGRNFLLELKHSF